MSAPRSVTPGPRPAALAASSPSSGAAGSPPGRPACAGLDPHIVFARRVKDAAPALRACTRCTLQRACEEAVAPADSWFDGVCAGRLWRNGHVIAGQAQGAEPAAGQAEPAGAAGAAGRGGHDGQVAGPTRDRQVAALALGDRPGLSRGFLARPAGGVGGGLRSA